ncbi:hypothetical protein [[Eubacterium] cellulosolvens]
MSDKEELIEKFKEGMQLEEGMINSMRQTASKVKNSVVKQLLNGIALDSEKHFDIYSSLIELSSGVTAVSENEKEKINAEIKNHIATEKRMIDFVTGIVNTVENDKIKFMLKYIAADENRHHRTLQAILDNVIVKEMISDEEWEDILYKDAVAHGAPVG